MSHFILDEIRGLYHAPWEKQFKKIRSPIDNFIHQETSGGILLLIATAIALVWANSPFADTYLHLLHTHLSIRVGSYELNYTLHHWVNDGLMVIFFFVVGLEIKRELVLGELSSVKLAAMPVFAALGGMVVPALVYVAFNIQSGGELRGWGIPMATDIAFAVGVLVLLGDRVPKALLTFLLALAIVDDLGAVLVIAVFYTEQVSIPALCVVLLIFLLLLSCNRVGIRSFSIYFVLGILMWLAMLKSGIHATVAGVLTAFTIPVRSRLDAADFGRHAKQLLAKYEQTKVCSEKRGISQSLEKGVHAVIAPGQRLENSLHTPVVFFILPLFALFNAGISLQMDGLLNAFTHPVTQGVIMGLVVGKLVGITLFSFIAMKLRVAAYPQGANIKHIIGVGLLGGIGFTMSIFISELGFVGQENALLMAKTGVLSASLLAGVLGYFWLLRLSPKQPHNQKISKHD